MILSYRKRKKGGLFAASQSGLVVVVRRRSNNKSCFGCIARESWLALIVMLFGPYTITR